jgi:NADPH:quinone reductase-like Zn-dependent oxidoreductase
MKAMVYHRYGGPEVLELVEMPEPKLSQNSVLVRIKAAAVNPADIQLQAGLGKNHTDAWFPVIPGWDMAGIVEKVGAGVSEYQPGDEVIGYVRQEILHHGTYAELVSTPVETLASKPSGTSWAEAAGLPLAGLTAMRAITHTLDIRPEERLLILGASGSVGSLAAQIAQERGAIVAGMGAPANQDYLRSIGVCPLTYGEDLASQLGKSAKRFDAVLDCAGRGALGTVLSAISKGTRIASIADQGEGITTVFARPNATALADLSQMASANIIKVAVAETYPLEHAPEAQRALMRPRAAGKIVLTL